MFILTNMISKEQIKNIKNKIIEQLDPKKIYLFGSYANESFAADSDLDIFANGDLHFARWGMQDKNPVFHTICFLCQTASEKYLKALLLING